MHHRIEHIVIVGGGTAGWLSAVCLNRVLSRTSETPCRITLIESSDIGTIGVGEATVVSIKNTFRLCDIDETDWMLKCNASFKMAIKFVGWSGGGGDEIYWHTFGPLPSLNGLPLSHFWLKRKLRGDPQPFASSCFSAVTLCEARKAPKLGDEKPYEGKEEYAYHLDAGLLAEYLKRLGKSRGVEQIVDNVLDVVLDERGYVSHLRTAKHGDLHGDLFIDCSGFRGLLVNEALKEPFVSFSDALLCDSAIAIPIPTDDETHGINPYTTATALRSGWVWHTPLFGRSGNGYVYSSACADKGAAETELRQHLGPGAERIEARHIRMRVGRTRNSWVKNCVGIGLAGGFIEPLESTGIWFIELALYNLVVNFPDKTFNPNVIQKFNSIMRKYYEQIRDFVVLHYCLTNREDTEFWRANKHNPAIPETLKANLELWSAMLPGHEKLDDPGFFKDYSYASIMAGLGRVPERGWPLLDHRDEAEVEPVFAGVRSKSDRLKRSLPDHYRYLAGLRCGEADGPRDGSGTETLTVQCA
jgi:tryptophan halogenase